MLAKTQGDAKLFIAQAGMVRREVLGKIAPVVGGAPAHGAFEQPFANTILRTPAHLANLAQQWRHMDSVP